MSNAKRGVYRLVSPSYRGGQLTGIFVARAEEIEHIKDSSVYFGEVLGKHSEVEIDKIGKYIGLITDNPAAVDTFELFEFETGYNPIESYKDFHGLDSVFDDERDSEVDESEA